MTAKFIPEIDRAYEIGFTALADYVYTRKDIEPEKAMKEILGYIEKFYERAPVGNPIISSDEVIINNLKYSLKERIVE